MTIPADTYDIAFLSYLAAVRTLYVGRYPQADYGAEVLRVEKFLAADGPIAAGAAIALGHRAVLLSNGLADDETGREVATLLTQWGVGQPSTASPRRVETPSSTVICDSGGGRTWFPYLPGVVRELAEMDLTPVLVSEILYVDCYEILRTAAVRAVDAALARGVPVIANLGGSPLPPWLGVVVRGRRRLMTLQTNVPDDEPERARVTAEELAAVDVADIVVVTAGRHGATARAGRHLLTVPAYPVDCTRTQGAGSVFSAAYLSGLLRGEELPAVLRFACAAGSLWCSQPPDEGPPSSERVASLVQDGKDPGQRIRDQDAVRRPSVRGR